MELRPATPADRDAIIALIDGVYREYGDRICLENADADLMDIDEAYANKGGEFIVLDDGGAIRGTHAVLPIDRPGVCTFRRLYLDVSLRGSGWGERLMEWAFDRAAELNFQRVEFWSDTRFTRAHRFFRRCGFQGGDEVRQMNDGWMDYAEYFFHRELPPREQAGESS